MKTHRLKVAKNNSNQYIVVISLILAKTGLPIGNLLYPIFQRMSAVPDFLIDFNFLSSDLSVY